MILDRWLRRGTWTVTFPASTVTFGTDTYQLEAETFVKLGPFAAFMDRRAPGWTRRHLRRLLPMLRTAAELPRPARWV